jgi:hypothetical protein
MYLSIDRLLDDFDPTDTASISFFDFSEVDNCGPRDFGEVLSSAMGLKGVELAWSSI